MEKIYIDSSLPQWKGNLHMHTVRSDGDLQPAEAAEQYRLKGYHFCLMSDHEIYWDSTELDREDFILLAGGESSIAHNPTRKWTITDDEASGEMSIHLHAIKDDTFEKT